MWMKSIWQEPILRWTNELLVHDLKWPEGFCNFSSCFIWHRAETKTHSFHVHLWSTNWFWQVNIHSEKLFSCVYLIYVCKTIHKLYHMYLSFNVTLSPNFECTLLLICVWYVHFAHVFRSGCYIEVSVGPRVYGFNNGSILSEYMK